jgi:hypothetical protein
MWALVLRLLAKVVVRAFEVEKSFPALTAFSRFASGSHNK